MKLNFALQSLNSTEETSLWLKTQVIEGSSTLKMETARSSETFVSYRNTTRHHNPEDFDLNLHRRKNLKIIRLRYHKTLFEEIPAG
jgi:hypothetical protein